MDVVIHFLLSVGASPIRSGQPPELLHRLCQIRGIFQPKPQALDFNGYFLKYRRTAKIHSSENRLILEIQLVN
jgi:hypothetical protein